MDPYTAGRLSQVYADSIQHARIGKEKEGGYVSLRFFEDEEEGNSKMEQSLQHVVQIIRDAISRGYKAGDIGILVRNNALAEIIADTLVRHHIDVVTPQSLLLGGDERIKLLVAAMQVVSSPGVSLFTASLIQKYAIVHNLSDLEDATIFERKLTDARLGMVVYLLEKLPELAVLPLDELNEWLIQQLLPGVEADAFFLAWQDVVSGFIGDGSARLQAFLEWWNEKGSTTTVQVPDSPHAVRLMTIHKSKGLQFPVVILPSVQWTLKPNSRQLLWVDADEMPYQKVPYIPVTCSSSLEQTYFATDYREECLTTLIDSINMLYVACTRAVDELYLLCPLLDMSKKSAEDFSDISHFFNAGAPEGLAGLNAEDVLTYSLGAPVMPGIPEERTGHPPISTYMSSTLASKVNMKTFTDEAAIQKGVAWHLMLAEITSSVQIGAVVQDFIARQPGIDETEAAISSRIRDILELEAALVPPSFQAAMSERDLLWHGEILRPDKIYLDGQQCLIIDYKTGKGAGSHLSQVRKYRQAMSACGFQVAGAWLIYTDSLETVAVE
jgi:ATP-dependent helicase/nuclease subunit A